MHSNHQATLLEVRVDLSNRFAKASISEVQTVLYCKVPMIFCGSAHDFVEAGVHDVDFTSAYKILHMRRILWYFVSHHF